MPKGLRPYKWARVYKSAKPATKDAVTAKLLNLFLIVLRSALRVLRGLWRPPRGGGPDGSALPQARLPDGKFCSVAKSFNPKGPNAYNIKIWLLLSGNLFRRTMPAFGVLETPVQCLRCKLDNVLPVGGSYKGPCVYDVGKSFWFLNQFFTQNL